MASQLLEVVAIIIGSTRGILCSSANTVFTGVLLGAFEVGSAFVILRDFALESHSIAELLKYVFSFPSRRFIVLHIQLDLVFSVGVIISERVVLFQEGLFESIECIVDIDSSQLRFSGSNQRIRFQTSHLN